MQSVSVEEALFNQSSELLDRVYSHICFSVWRITWPAVLDVNSGPGRRGKCHCGSPEPPLPECLPDVWPSHSTFKDEPSLKAVLSLSGQLTTVTACQNVGYPANRWLCLPVHRQWTRLRDARPLEAAALLGSASYLFLCLPLLFLFCHSIISEVSFLNSAFITKWYRGRDILRESGCICIGLVPVL